MDCRLTVSELYMYISSVSLPLNEPYKTLVIVYASLLYVSMITLHFVCVGRGGGGCLICLIVLVVKLLTGFETFGPPVKDFIWSQCKLLFCMVPPLFRYLKV